MDGGIRETSAFLSDGAEKKKNEKRGRAENDMAALCAFNADVFTWETIGSKCCSEAAENRHMQHTGRHESTIGETSEPSNTQEPPVYLQNKSLSAFVITLTGLTVLQYRDKVENREFSSFPRSCSNPVRLL